MEVERYDDARAFYARVAPFLERNEAAHTFHLGLRERLERDPHTFGPADPVLVAAFDRGEVIGIATQTPPYQAVLSLFDDVRGAEAIAERLQRDGVNLPGVMAPLDAGPVFVDRWCALTGARARVTLEERIYEATEVVPPRPTSGRMRPYAETDRDVVLGFMAAFHTEAMPDSPEPDPEEFLRRRLAEAEGGLVLWEDGGRPVSLAGYGAPSPNAMRIGPVYTPPALRGRGYASALTAAVTEHVLASGRRFCFLFTNLANPTSNSIYQKIGYRPVLDVNAWTFERP
jgi:GNAT superfamily N-acetyltransferase